MEERSHIDRRPDVLTYTIAPLETDLHFAGDVAVEMDCSADTLYHDLCAVSKVCVDGKVYNLTQKYLHVNKMRSPLRVVLQPTCVKIAKGNALRLSLSAACFPAYPINPGTSSPMGTTRLIDSQIVTLAVHCGGDRASRVLLPVAPSK